MMPTLLSLPLVVVLTMTLQHVQASAMQDPSTFFGRNSQISDNDYWNWYQSVGAKQYESAAFIPSVSDGTKGAAVHWSIDDNDQETPYLHLAIAVPATGWLGLGLSENGGMKGADVLLFERRNPTTVLDAYIRNELQPVLDTCQNWEFVNAVTDSDEYLILQVRRLLDTGDVMHDRPILQDGDSDISPSLLIAAWGDTEEHSYHGPDNKARSSIRWYDNAYDVKSGDIKIMDEHADGYFDIRANEHPIKAQDTEYFNFCFSWDDLLAMGVPENAFSAIGFFPIVDGVEYVHHFILYGLHNTMNGRPCSDAGFNPVYGWARGEPTFALPLDLGILMGPGSYQSFRLSIHYDNPKSKADVLDSSGVRIYYTKELRPVELGIARIGDARVALNGTRLDPGLSQHVFDCPSTCAQTFLPEPVTVLREQLHMHYIGRSMKNEVIRDGEVVHTGSVDYFDFDQMGNQWVQQAPFVIQPGDAFRTYCNYDNTGKNTTFGYSSQEEMCQVIMYYYPRQSLLGIAPWVCGPKIGFFPCEATHSTAALETVPRVFGPYLTDNNDNIASDTLRQARSSAATCHVANDDGSSVLPSTSSSSSPSPALVSHHWHILVVNAVAVAVVICLMGILMM